MRTLYHHRAASTFVLLLALAPALAAAQSDESYELELHFIGLDGQPSDPSHVTAYVLDESKTPHETEVELEADATAKLHLPSGSYTIASYENVPLGAADDGRIVTMLAYPDLKLDSDTSIELDARVAKPVEVEPPLPAAELYSLHVAWDIRNHSRGVSIDHKGRLFTGRLGPDIRSRADMCRCEREALMRTATTSKRRSFARIAWSNRSTGEPARIATLAQAVNITLA